MSETNQAQDNENIVLKIEEKKQKIRNMEEKLEPKALAIECPGCGAGPKNPCLTKSGNPTDTHEARRDKFKEKFSDMEAELRKEKRGLHKLEEIAEKKEGVRDILNKIGENSRTSRSITFLKEGNKYTVILTKNLPEFKLEEVYDEVVVEALQDIENLNVILTLYPFLPAHGRRGLI